MVSNYTIRSKICVKPQKKTYIFKILLNICLVFVMIAGIIKILFDGLDWGTLGTMALAIVIVSLYQKRPSNTEHYEFALVDASISSVEMILIYRQVESYKNRDFKINIPFSKITVLEFSDRLCCLHIYGKITGEVIGNNGSIVAFSDYYLYLEQGMEGEFIASIQEVTDIPIRYIDRLKNTD